MGDALYFFPKVQKVHGEPVCEFDSDATELDTILREYCDANEEIEASYDHYYSTFPSIKYEEKNVDPVVGNASFYGKFDGDKIRDTFSCKPMAIADGRRFHPFKLMIASNTIPVGTFVKISLLDDDGKVVKDSNGDDIFVIAEVADKGPYGKALVEDKKRKFDLSYGIAEYFSKMAEGKVPFTTNGNVIKGHVSVSVKPVELSEEDIHLLRAYTFEHKITKFNPKTLGERTWCLNVEKRFGDYWVMPSLGDKYEMGWNPPESMITMKDFLERKDPNQVICALASIYQYSAPLGDTDAKDKSYKMSLYNRYFLMNVLGIQKHHFDPYMSTVEVDPGSKVKVYGANLIGFTLNQAVFLWQTLIGFDKVENIEDFKVFDVKVRQEVDYDLAAMSCKPIKYSIFPRFGKK